MRAERIAYVINVFPKLSETFIANELAHLRARGAKVRVLSLRTPSETLRHSWIEQSGLIQETVYNSAEFLPALREFRPQLLHAHFATEPTAAAQDFSRVLNVPFTFTAHGYDIHRKAPADFRARAMAAKKVVTVSEANAAYIHDHFQVPAEHVQVIPCGVDTERFRPRSLPRNDEPPLILCVARHVAVKNLEMLLRACALIRSRGIRFRCVLIGDGPCRDELEKLRDQLLLNEQVEFWGGADQDEVLSWWQRAQLGVLASHNEGLPVCLMEAGACGVPVVATAVGGIPELVRDGVTGLLVPPNDVAAFAEALARLLSKPALRSTMGAAARVTVRERFSVDRQIDQLLDLWEEILQ